MRPILSRGMMFRCPSGGYWINRLIVIVGSRKEPLAPMSDFSEMSSVRSRRIRHALAALSVAATAVVAGAGVASAGADTVRQQAYADESRLPESSLWAVITAKSTDEVRSQKSEDLVVITPAVHRSTRALATGDQASADQVPAEPTTNDPLEPVNRVLFGLNEAIDMVVLRPVSFLYRTIVPSPLRFGVANMVANASAPVTFANDLLQGDVDAAKVTLVRFMVNSTAGFGGMVDAAAAAGLNGRTEDFGQTLGVWGAGPGPYLVLPVLGPTTVRDGAGRIVDIAFSPLTWILWDYSTVERLSPTMATVVTTHESIMDELQALRQTSPDMYASVRDIYLQKRAGDVANGAAAADVLEPINPVD